jgi:uncharacterized protein (TIGR02270 family)
VVVSASRPVLWDIYEEHLEEAAFLWDEWESALVAANHTLDSVAAGPEARLLAHLDGLVLGGAPVAEKLLLPALAGDEPGRIAAAAWALVQAEGAPRSGDVAATGLDPQDAVIDAMTKGEPAQRAAIARALRLSPRADLSRVARLWPDGSPEVRGVVFDLLRAGEPAWVRQHLEPVLRGGDSIPLAGALRALRQAPDRALVGCVDDALKTELREVRREAMTTGIVFGSAAAWDVCRRSALRAGDTCRLPLALLATSPQPSDRAVVVSFARDSKVKRHAIWALGFAGDLEAADLLVEATADEKVARAAGEALTAITGVALGGELATPAESNGPAGEETGDDDPPPVVHAEDHLVLPNPRAIKSWWQGERGRFPPGVRHVFGRPRTPDALRAALMTAPMWRREVMCLEVAVATNLAPAVDVTAWTRDQRRALASGAGGTGAPSPAARTR